MGARLLVALLTLILACSGLLSGMGPFAAPLAFATSRPAGGNVVTIDVALGCTCTIEEVLSSHEHDTYYLGTSYGNTGPNGAGGPVDTWSSRYPNGRPNPSTGLSYMNCAGFVSAVITEAGGDVSPIANYVNPTTGYNRGNDTNASKWQGWTDHNAVEMYDFPTKEAMLSSGILERGDIIYIHPQSFSGDDDCHIGFFWGSTSSEDLFWHSSSHGDGIIAGNAPGNMISRITPKSPASYYRVIKTTHEVEINFRKVSKDATVDLSDPYYSMAGAQYEVRRESDNALAGTITLDEEGRASLVVQPNTVYYAVETKAPDGWTLNTEHIRFNSMNGNTVDLPVLLEEWPKPPVLLQKVSGSDGTDTSGPYYSLEGAVYEIHRASDDKLVETVTTDARGQAQTHLEANTEYYAVEVQAPQGFQLNPTPVSFNSGSGTVVTLSDLPHVTVTFTKTSADASLTDGNELYAYEGATYEIHHTADDALVDTITTDEAGHASLKLEPNEAYYAVETQAPQGFVANPDRISFNTGTADTSVQLEDEPGTVTLRIVKRDATGSTQRGLNLAGAEYRLTDANGEVHTATTDDTGQATVTGLPLGTITLVETKAPTGYQLDPAVHTYTVDAGQLTDAGVIELTTQDDCTEIPVAFDIDVVKYADSGAESSGLQEPASGVRFDIISNTTNEAVGFIVTDEGGYATTAGQWFGSGTRIDGVAGALPYDQAGYTVHEDPATTPEGYQPVGDWTITPDDMKDGVTLHYIVDNDFVSSRIQIVKQDAETGRTVPLAGFSFELLDEQRNPVTQEVWYPQHEELSVFTTDESGTVTFPEALKPGTYYVRETSATAPYLSTDEEIRIEIADDAETTPITIATISDDQAMGQATIEKTCDAPEGSDDPSVCDDGCTGTLAGTEFDVIAQEDIISPDGTPRAVTGEIVDHVVTGEDGTATTKMLHLGDGTATYAFVETKPAPGHVLDATPHEFTLSYRDDHTPVVTATVSALNHPTETVLTKTVLGHDDALPGTVFTWWRAEDERPVTVDDATHAALAVDADAGTTVAITPINDLARLTLGAPDGWSVVLESDGAAALKALGESMVKPGTYEVTILNEQDVAVELSEPVSIDLVADHAYALTVTSSIFHDVTVSLADQGAASETHELSYDEQLEAHVDRSLEPGTYRVDLHGETRTVTLEAGDTCILDDTLNQAPVVLANSAEWETATTNDAGELHLRHLQPGSYRLYELDAPDGFLPDGEIRYFTIDQLGRTEGLERYDIDLANDFTKVRLSKRSITNEDEIPGAQLAIRDATGTIIESWTSTEEDHLIEALAPGSYELVEQMTPHSYDEATAVPFTVDATGAVQQVVMYDEPLTITGEVDKRQEIADPTHPYTDADAESSNGGNNNAPTSISDDGRYDYEIDARSTASTWVDEFTVTDELSAVDAGLAELLGITTPVAAMDYDGKLNVWYRTNQTPEDYRDPHDANATRDDGHLNPWLDDEAVITHLGDDGRALSYDGWQLWARDVNATEATELSVQDLDLAEGEQVIAIRLEYGRVEEGFTTREDDWDRNDLKDEHDDLADISDEVDARTSGAPVIVHMRVTDTYQEGSSLDNSARVDLYRNGGNFDDGETLEDHDEDRVVQHPVDHLPAIGTTLTDEADSDHEVVAGKVTLVDTVSYHGIEPGRSHVMTGTLMDRETEEPVLDQDGNPVTASTTFTPDAADGTTQVIFKLDTSELTDHHLVAFEQLYLEEPEGDTSLESTDDEPTPVARHEELDDEGQTIQVVSPPAPSSPTPLDQTGLGGIIPPLTGITLALGITGGIRWSLRRRKDSARWMR